MDSEALLEEHIAKNKAMVNFLKSRPLTPETQILLAALQAQVIRSFVHHPEGARKGDIRHAQDDANGILAGLVTGEAGLSAVYRQTLAIETPA